MKTTRTLLFALAAMSTWAAQTNAKGEEVAGKPLTVSAPAAAIQPADSGNSPKDAKDLKIASLENRMAELEARIAAYHVKISAIEKRHNPSPRITNTKTRGPNFRK